uniref:Ionotropic glutamate receptor C-terminal domain-containing protein n=1 Tax=Rhodnius prolixus TaxID=13249 RepID=T1H7N0_RHOPR
MSLMQYCTKLLLLVSYIFASFGLEFKLISNYFKTQHLSVITACVCNRKDAIFLARNLNAESFRSKVHTPQSNDNLEFKARQYEQGIYIDLTCEYNQKLMETEYNSMNTSFKWLAWLGKASFNCLDGSFIGADTDMVVATEAGMLYEAYRISLAHPATVNLIGNWTSSGEFTIGPRPFRDLSGATLRGSVYVYELKVGKNNFSNIILNKMIEPDLDIFHRYNFALEEELRFIYKYNLQPVFANATGHLLPNGRFIGMVGDIAENRSDIGLSSAQPMATRQNVVRFLTTLQQMKMIFVMMNPKTVGTYKALLLPLSEGVWATLAGITVATVLCYHFIQRYSMNRQDDYEISAGVVYAIGLVAQQGIEGKTVTFSSRLMSVMLLFLAIILSACYNASIMNGLLTPAPIKIKNVVQLVDSHFDLGMVDLPYLTMKDNYELYFSKKALKKIFSTKDSIVDIQSGLERVKNSKFAFAAEDVLIRTETNRLFNNIEKCDIKELEITRFPLAMPIQKNCTYRELFTRGLLWIREVGLSKRLKDHWYPEPAFCLGNPQFINVTLEAVSVALLIFLFGLLLSMFIFLGENVVMKRKMKRKGIIKVTRIKQKFNL